ncbi:hypothetical protein GGX14DRAFT_390002 [Mycena pura]|uniref:Uncharacterized protein n=1 Tax=Mycena pura TaxID=153505 RepID=A0AAD6YG19_9AGAR|nr:hypothetical protein GGX14DRAFT_390002 [Mycena pura]
MCTDHGDWLEDQNDRIANGYNIDHAMLYSCRAWVFSHDRSTFSAVRPLGYGRLRRTALVFHMADDATSDSPLSTVSSLAFTGAEVGCVPMEDDSKPLPANGGEFTGKWSVNVHTKTVVCIGAALYDGRADPPACLECQHFLDHTAPAIGDADYENALRHAALLIDSNMRAIANAHLEGQIMYLANQTDQLTEQLSNVKAELIIALRERDEFRAKYTATKAVNSAEHSEKVANASDVSANTKTVTDADDVQIIVQKPRNHCMHAPDNVKATWAPDQRSAVPVIEWRVDERGAPRDLEAVKAATCTLSTDRYWVTAHHLMAYLIGAWQWDAQGRSKSQVPVDILEWFLAGFDVPSWVLDATLRNHAPGTQDIKAWYEAMALPAFTDPPQAFAAYMQFMEVDFQGCRFVDSQWTVDLSLVWGRTLWDAIAPHRTDQFSSDAQKRDNMLVMRAIVQVIGWGGQYRNFITDNRYPVATKLAPVRWPTDRLSDEQLAPAAVAQVLAAMGLTDTFADLWWFFVQHYVREWQVDPPMFSSAGVSRPVVYLVDQEKYQAFIAQSEPSLAWSPAPARDLYPRSSLLPWRTSRDQYIHNRFLRDWQQAVDVVRTPDGQFIRARDRLSIPPTPAHTPAYGPRNSRPPISRPRPPPARIDDDVDMMSADAPVRNQRAAARTTPYHQPNTRFGYSTDGAAGSSSRYAHAYPKPQRTARDFRNDRNNLF